MSERADWREDLADIRAALPQFAVVGHAPGAQQVFRRANDAADRLFHLLRAIEREVTR